MDTWTRTQVKCLSERGLVCCCVLEHVIAFCKLGCNKVVYKGGGGGGSEFHSKLKAFMSDSKWRK